MCDRKDIVLTGHGRIKIVHVLLLESVEHYRKENKREVNELANDCRKNYAAGEIKVYTINDQLESHCLTYTTKSHLLKEFSL